MRCNHRTTEQIEEFHGLVVLQCSECNTVFLKGILTPDVSLSECFDIAKKNMEKYKSMLLKYLEEYSPKFGKISSKLEKKNWWLKTQKNKSGNEYLVIYLHNDSLKHNGNVRGSTVRSLGNLRNFPKINEVLVWKLQYTAWKMITKHILLLTDR